MATLNIKPAYAYAPVLDLGEPEPLYLYCNDLPNAVDGSIDTFAVTYPTNVGTNLTGILFSFSTEQLLQISRWQITGVQFTLDCELSFRYGDGGYVVLMPCSRDSASEFTTIDAEDMITLETFPEISEMAQADILEISRHSPSDPITVELSDEIMEAANNGYTSIFVAAFGFGMKIYDASLTLTGNKKINKVVFGNETLIDLSDDTVTEDGLLEGYTAHDASGALITGTAIEGTDTSDATATEDDIADGATAYVDGVLLTGTNTNNCDTSEDTVSAANLATGITAHDSSGTQITGTGNIVQNGIAYTSLESHGYPLTAKVLGNTLYPGMFGAANASVSNNPNYYIQSIELPAGLTSIPNNAFQNCVAYNLSALPNGVTSIGDYAFSNCQRLSLTELPDGVTSIGLNAFHSCAALQLTKLPAGLTSIGDNAFYNCKKIVVNSLPTGLTEFKTNTFYACSELRLTALPQNLTTIGPGAFYYCSKISPGTIAASVLIGKEAFIGCSGLGPKLKIKTPKIGSLSNMSKVFGNCTGLKAVWISNMATTIYGSSLSYAPFNGCSNLTDIYTDATEKPSGWSTYWNYTASGTQATVHWGVSEAEFDALTVS